MKAGIFFVEKYIIRLRYGLVKFAV